MTGLLLGITAFLLGCVIGVALFIRRHKNENVSFLSRIKIDESDEEAQA